MCYFFLLCTVMALASSTMPKATVAADMAMAKSAVLNVRYLSNGMDYGAHAVAGCLELNPEPEN